MIWGVGVGVVSQAAPMLQAPVFCADGCVLSVASGNGGPDPLAPSQETVPAARTDCDLEGKVESLSLEAQVRDSV